MGYRDYLKDGSQDPKQYLVVDFLPRERLAELEAVLDKQRPIYNCDLAEDVAGGLKACPYVHLHDICQAEMSSRPRTVTKASWCYSLPHIT